MKPLAENTSDTQRQLIWEGQEIQIQELIQKTATALTDDTLRLLFVSVQQNNIDLCIQFAVEGQLDLQCLVGLC